MPRHLKLQLSLLCVVGACSPKHEHAFERPSDRASAPAGPLDNQPQEDSTLSNRGSLPGVVVWRENTMWVHVLSGDSLRFEDVSSECCPVSNQYLGTLPSGHLVVESSYEDGTKVSVIDPRSGAVTELPAKPVPSPSGRLIVAGDEDALSDDLLSVWRLVSTGWRREYVAPNQRDQYWAPRAIRWLNDSTVTLTQDFHDSTRIGLLQWRGGRWSLERGP